MSHEILAGDETHAAREQRRERERLGLEHAGGGGRLLIKRVEHDAAGAAFWERMLLVVDEAALHRKGHQHAEDRQHDREADDLPRGQHVVGRPHVGGEARRERHRHVARGGRDRLHAVVLEDRHVACAEPREDPVDRKGQDHRREPDAERPARLCADIQVRDAEQAAEQEARDGRAQRELRHVAAEYVVEPPAVLLLAGPGADLFFGEVEQGHRFVTGRLRSREHTCHAAGCVLAPARTMISGNLIKICRSASDS